MKALQRILCGVFLFTATVNGFAQNNKEIDVNTLEEYYNVSYANNWYFSG